MVPPVHRRCIRTRRGRTLYQCLHPECTTCRKEARRRLQRRLVLVRREGHLLRRFRRRHRRRCRQQQPRCSSLPRRLVPSAGPRPAPCQTCCQMQSLAVLPLPPPPAPLPSATTGATAMTPTGRERPPKPLTLEPKPLVQNSPALKNCTLPPPPPQ
ncbi:unnamed protein product, partial [Ectocarpus sp. 8 AP-2014]